jgi:hypothetical protein
MSIFSAIGRLFKKVWAAIKKILKKFWPIILIILVIVICIYFPGFFTMAWGYLSSLFATIGGWITTAWTALAGWVSGALNWAGAAVSSLGWGEWLKLAAGVAIVANPGGVIGGIADAIVGIAKAIPWYVWAAGATALYFWLSPSSSKEDEATKVVIRQQREITPYGQRFT